MLNSATQSKIKKFLEKMLITKIEVWAEKLRAGDLLGYENELGSTLMAVYNFVSEELLQTSSEQLKEELKKEGQLRGGEKMVYRELSVRIMTGQQIKVMSPYAKKVSGSWQGSRHVLAQHWKLVSGASPALCDRVGYCAALGPSYELARETLKKFGTKLSISSVRDITNRLAEHCQQLGEEALMLENSENLSGKTVIISLDGGRTRTRIYDGGENENGQPTYQTAWAEPKLFVIDVLDKEGCLSQYELPVYGCRFGKEDTLILLRNYLKKLQIHQASKVQIVADGAPWIWNGIISLLKELKVEENRIVQTLDYYHASAYVHGLVERMPQRVEKKERKSYLNQFKDQLWKGQIDEILQACGTIYKRPSALVKRWMSYLTKHKSRMQYADYKENKLFCGSGIIESAVRRIINLRFKNASTFWKKEIVEKLYFLRAALVSKRWNIFIQNLAGSS